ncbi:hypothetical protein GGD88_000708 [Roseospira goensis]|uniref:Uncharacterized protein n=1 Tax=Roseospira goensis TaxID=391922 RepID=A0A7W6RYM5_9PROT|nr:hypothetical protein [Roseospira goensis]
MIVRLLLEGLFSLGRPATAATLKPRPPAPRRGSRRSRPSFPLRGRPDLMMMTGAMSAPPTIPHRAVRGRRVTWSGLGGRWAA